MKNKQSGFALLAAPLVVLVVAAAGLVAWRVTSSNKTTDSKSATSSTSSSAGNNQTASGTGWSFNGSAWASTGTAPSCSNPLTIQSPVDINKASAILYPGQYRGGNYKAHGGFIFRGSANDAITIKVPEDAAVYKGSRYIEAGEVQYMFVLIAPCGVMYRFDHLLTLSPEFQKLADSLPAARVNNSETTNFPDAPRVKAGAVVATAVGFKKTNNTGVDFGVYDLRAKNAVSQTAAWQKEHPSDSEFGAYGICWLNNLPANDKAKALALPGGDGQMGKTSDYCK